MLQPLDVGVFGPFQRAWADRCDDIIEDTGEEMPREQFVKHYMEVRQKTFKESTIINAFRKSGCWPINPDVFTEEDYTPSITTSTTSTHVPSSYPRMATQHEDDQADQASDASDSNPESGDSDSNESSDEHATNPAVHVPQASYPVLPSGSTTTTTTSFLPTPIPPSVFYAQTRSRSKLHPGRVPAPTFQAENAELQARVTVLESRVATAEAHAALAHTEIQALKRQLNAKKDKSTKRRKLNVEARWLNSDEGLRIAQEQEASRTAEEQRKKEGRELRAAKQAEREKQRRQRDPNKPFTGSLMTKTKADLQDVAQVLGLTIDGQKKELLARINAYFNEHPLLCEDPRFEGIFNRSQRRSGVQNDENHPPTVSPQAGPLLSTVPTAHPYFGVAPLTTNVINTLLASQQLLPS